MKLASLNLRLFEVKLPEILLDRPRAGPVLMPAAEDPPLTSGVESARARGSEAVGSVLSTVGLAIRSRFNRYPPRITICDEHARFYQLLSCIRRRVVCQIHYKLSVKMYAFQLELLRAEMQVFQKPSNGTTLRNKVTMTSRLGLTTCLASGASAGARLAFSRMGCALIYLVINKCRCQR